LVVTLNPSFPQDKLREGSKVWEYIRFFAEFILSPQERFFAALRMTGGEGLRMTNRFDGGVF
jgi:hypothetical protein